MGPFEKIIGNRDAKNYFKRAIDKNNLSHSYIFEGNYGIGKKTFALELAKALLCKDKKDGKPCEACKVCEMINAYTHPDVIWIEQDTKVTKIDNIRENIVYEMEIKPYQSEYKIIIVKLADSISVQGQNALLKTIEEPPSYGIIILVCENMSNLLPTIKSRCIIVRFNPISTQEMEAYLKEKSIMGMEAEIYSKLSGGSIGVIEDILQDESYMPLRKKSIEYLNRLSLADVMGLYDIVKEVTEDKEAIEKVLKFWLLWYRDIAVLKVSGNRDLYYKDYERQLLDTSSKLTYNKVNKNIEFIKGAIADIRQNVYSTFVIENLLLQLKERKK